MAPPPPPPELNPDVVAEILLLLPPDDPAGLVRASAVCKLWLQTLTDPVFLRRYRACHGTRRVLGFLRNQTDRSLPRFVSTTAFLPHASAAGAHRNCDVFDCRHGRVLLYDYRSMEFVVWDPVTGRESRVPGEWPNVSSKYAVLCAAGAGCDHSTCSGGPSLLASVGVDGSYFGKAVACIYSSETGARSIRSYLDLELFYLKDRSPTLVGGALYFSGGSGKLLRYDVVSSQGLSLIKLPEANHFGRVIVVPAEDSEFGLVSMYRECLCLWSRETEVGGGTSWVQHRVIDFKNHLPASNLKCQVFFSGFAEDVNVIFVSTDDVDGCVFSIDLNSLEVRKVCEMGCYGIHIFPYVCFFTPAACARSALSSPVETR